TYSLKDASFPTIDPEDPYRLTEEEEAVVVRLVQSFRNSERLQEHISFMIDKGMIYLPYNDNLLFHGCLPVHEDGSLMALEVEGKLLAGKELFDAFDYAVRQGFNLHRQNRPTEHYLDLMWYLWTGPASPLFGREEMTTFERYYIEDKETHVEKKNAYFELRNEESFCLFVLREFGIPVQNGHIINGHTPVKERKGEDPIKANGRMIVIDGGYSKPYQKKTGLGGYTLLYNSY